MDNAFGWLHGRRLYFMGKQVNPTHSHIGVMCTHVEVEWVILFDKSPGKIKAYEIAFEWIKPTLSPYPTIEEGPVEWTGINSIFSHIELNRPVTFSFDQEDPTSTFALERTHEYKQMLYFIKSGFKYHDLDKIYMRNEEEEAGKFLTAFLNAHRNFEEYEILLKIIFALADYDEIDINEVLDNVSNTENKEALLLIIKKADERKISMTARWDL